MSAFNFLNIPGNAASPVDLVGLVQRQLEGEAVDLKSCYLNIQGQAFSESQLNGRKTLVAFDLAELNPAWYEKELEQARIKKIREVQSTKLNDKTYPDANFYILSFLVACLDYYTKISFEEIDRLSGNLLESLNTKLLFLSFLEENFTESFEEIDLKEFYLAHARELAAGEYTKLLDKVKFKETDIIINALASASSSHVICQDANFFSAEQVLKLNEKASRGITALYAQLASTLKSPKQHFDHNFESLIHSNQYFKIKPIYNAMYLHAEYVAHALTKQEGVAQHAVRFAYGYIYPLLNSDIARFLNGDKDVTAEGLNQFIDEQYLKYQTVVESVLMSYLSSFTDVSLRENRAGWLAENTAVNMDLISTCNDNGRLTYVEGSRSLSSLKTSQYALTGKAAGELLSTYPEVGLQQVYAKNLVEGSKIDSRLNKLQKLTEERFARYGEQYREDNLAKLACAVIGDYATGRWRWRSHFKKEGQHFLQEHRDLLGKGQLTSADKWRLLQAVRALHSQIHSSADFSDSSSFSTRLAFLEAKISEQLEFECEAKFKEVEADMQRELVGVTTSKGAKDLLEKVHALEKQVDRSLADMGGPFRMRLVLLESKVFEMLENISLEEALNAAVLAGYDQVVKVESAREALIMQAGLEKLAMQEQCQTLSVMSR
ncbi:hypothetical protein AVI51_05805 [Piscirickettsia salmonis]|uniref:Uncharacterized protein n=1 Tax=Piscirickettsia salmonis TaxID=1238 RepID=A0A9Q6PVE3_PISSA|nr:hypothetical protein [Piscirickettsia salmonis]ALA25600.1 hypothetical protein KW89_2134 [Piscirickettsia salmonis]APS43106.1 hypothetical protein AVI48_01030 [Piscirickettsia salmonis]APS46453.1 hypothetical protein AVI49_01625 [Piscirickettsia salmonis]APS50421.1 hypothetical protein AVI50_05870 [Piscirickettsia salmonis]APS53624.1 hypothetical protein AVI51_05805 [Piscirickettsia salmonis]